jgi:hypothetical protein
MRLDWSVVTAFTTWTWRQVAILQNIWQIQLVFQLETPRITRFLSVLSPRINHKINIWMVMFSHSLNFLFLLTLSLNLAIYKIWLKIEFINHYNLSMIRSMAKKTHNIFIVDSCNIGWSLYRDVPAVHEDSIYSSGTMYRKNLQIICS